MKSIIIITLGLIFVRCGSALFRDGSSKFEGKFVEGSIPVLLDTNAYYYRNNDYNDTIGYVYFQFRNSGVLKVHIEMDSLLTNAELDTLIPKSGVEPRDNYFIVKNGTIRVEWHFPVERYYSTEFFKIYEDSLVSWLLFNKDVKQVYYKLE